MHRISRIRLALPLIDCGNVRKHAGAGNRHELCSRGIVTVSGSRWSPARRGAPDVAETGFQNLHQIINAAALPIKGVGHHSGRKLTFAKHAAHRDHVNRTEPAANDRKQFKAGHCPHVEVRKHDIRDFLTNLDKCREAAWRTARAISEIAENIRK